MDIRAGKQMRERGPRGKANGGKGVLAGKQMLGSLGFDIFSSPAHKLSPSRRQQGNIIHEMSNAMDFLAMKIFSLPS